MLSWNLFHGRDHPPDPKLLTWRSRLLRITERGETHAQVNRELLNEFATVLRRDPWQIAVLQECPPRWWDALAERCEADAHGVLTSRNPPVLGSVLSRLARFNPDLLASWEGGSNLTLVRGSVITSRAREVLGVLPERRVLAITELESGLTVGNLHLSERRERAEREAPTAAAALARAGGAGPLVLAGDFNLRPHSSGPVFEMLRTDHGLTGVTGDRSIDHVLVAGAGAGPAERLADQWREVPDPSHYGSPGSALPIRLSDHVPVARTIEIEPG